MKQTFTLLSLCLALLFTNCTPKENFQFSNIPTEQGVKKKMPSKINEKPQMGAFAEEDLVKKSIRVADSVLLTASTAPLPLLKAVAIPKKVLPVDFKTTAPGKIPPSKLALSPVKILKLQKAIHKQLKSRPDEGTKPVNKLAKAGFILGLGALGLFLLAGITSAGVLSTLAILAAIGGLITSISGLKEINRNPDQYAGKGKAIAGVSISAGLLFLLLITILAVLAAFSNFQ